MGGNLNITELSVKAVETAHDEDMAECDQQKQAANDLVSQYQSELAELDQIAKPSVRYDHVTKVSISKESSLLQEGAFTKEVCVAFLQLQRKKRHAKHAHAGNSTTEELSMSQEPEEKE